VFVLFSNEKKKRCEQIVSTIAIQAEDVEKLEEISQLEGTLLSNVTEQLSGKRVFSIVDFRVCGRDFRFRWDTQCFCYIIIDMFLLFICKFHCILLIFVD
jgi:hypothetical protein